MSKADDMLDAVLYYLYSHDSPYDRTQAVCRECEGVYWTGTPQHGMIEHCGQHPPLSEL